MDDIQTAYCKAKGAHLSIRALRNPSTREILMRITLFNKTAGGISGGYRKYLQAMVPRITNDSSVHALQCITPRSWHASSWLSFENTLNFFEYTPSPLLRSPATVIAEIARFSPDVIFVPTERTLLYRAAPVVNLFRNLDPFIENIRQYSVVENAKTIARRFDARHMFSVTKKIIVPTTFVQNFLIEHEKVAAKKIAVVHYGSDDSGAGDEHEQPPVAIKKLGPRPEFLLTAGAIRPGRGLEDALLAIAALRDHHNVIDTLVIAGHVIPRMDRYALKLKNLCRQLDISDQVVWTGNLPRRELYWCFRNCSSFLLTTRMETFCNIAIEALSTGCKIVATNSSCLPEILAEHALYYSPGDFSALADATVRLREASNPTISKFSSSARHRAASFDWDKTASETVHVLSDAIRI